MKNDIARTLRETLHPCARNIYMDTMKMTELKETSTAHEQIPWMTRLVVEAR